MVVRWSRQGWEMRLVSLAMCEGAQPTIVVLCRL